MNVLKLGTRKSLLAWAQSSWVAREIERLNPGVSVELFGIETRGDRIQNVSLQQVAGKEFFVAELDDALREKRVDFTVHSMKDLSLDRPAEFILGCIPARENPRDVVLFGPRVMEKLAAGKKLKIGTSSPRRIENIPSFLMHALPQFKGRAAEVELVEIRGNVNTRLGRVHEPEGSERALDAVVLAFAGLIRLWNDSAGRTELSKLLNGVRWMVLPLKECPAAPAQGALAVECRHDDERVRGILGKLHDPSTERTVSMERQLLADWGGGCHQRFGATALHADALGDVMWVRGVKPDGDFVDEFRWKAPASSATSADAWDGMKWRAQSEKTDEALEWSADLRDRCVFVAHSRAVRGEKAEALRSARVWTSGTASWFRLAAMGVWVEGCAELLGYEKLKPVLSEPVLQLSPLGRRWRVLTHEGATVDWPAGSALATYRMRATYSDAAKQALRAAKHVFWSSGSQFDALKNEVSPGAIQACGAGKTADRLTALVSGLKIFPTVEEWRRWIEKSTN